MCHVNAHKEKTISFVSTYLRWKYIFSQTNFSIIEIKVERWKQIIKTIRVTAQDNADHPIEMYF